MTPHPPHLQCAQQFYTNSFHPKNWHRRGEGGRFRIPSVIRTGHERTSAEVAPLPFVCSSRVESDLSAPHSFPASPFTPFPLLPSLLTRISLHSLPASPLTPYPLLPSLLSRISPSSFPCPSPHCHPCAPGVPLQSYPLSIHLLHRISPPHILHSHPPIPRNM